MWHGNYMVNAVVQCFTGNLNVIMIVSGLELCCHCSYLASYAVIVLILF